MPPGVKNTIVTSYNRNFAKRNDGNPDTHAQARRLQSLLLAVGVPARAYGKGDSNHSRLNNDLGKHEDPATREFYKFLDPLMGKR